MSPLLPTLALLLLLAPAPCQAQCEDHDTGGSVACPAGVPAGAMKMDGKWMDGSGNEIKPVAAPAPAQNQPVVSNPDGNANAVRNSAEFRQFSAQIELTDSLA